MPCFGTISIKTLAQNLKSLLIIQYKLVNGLKEMSLKSEACMEIGC